MPLRSMTGYAQVKAAANGELSFSLSLKSVNHRFLDLQLRLPADSDALEMKLRRLLKEQIEIVRDGGDPIGIIRDPEKNKIVDLDTFHEPYGLYRSESRAAETAAAS